MESSEWQSNSSFTWCTKKKSPEGAEPHTLFSHWWRCMPCVRSNVFKSFCNPKKEILESLGICYWESLLYAVAHWSDTAGSHFQSMCSNCRRNNWARKTPVTLGSSTGEIKGLIKHCKGSPSMPCVNCAGHCCPCYLFSSVVTGLFWAQVLRCCLGNTCPPC